MKAVALKIIIALLLVTFISYNSSDDAPIYSHFNWGIQPAVASF